MANCRACGGVLGRDCYNEADCLEISRSNDQMFQDDNLIQMLMECRSTIKWLWENSKPNDNSLQSDFFNIPANCLSQIEQVLPPEPKPISDDPFDNLPF